MSKFAKNNAPENCENLQAEIPYSKDKPLTVQRKELINKVVQGIHKTENIGFNEINYLGDVNIEYGYVIYDANRKKLLKSSMGFLMTTKFIIVAGLENGHTCGVTRLFLVERE